MRYVVAAVVTLLFPGSAVAATWSPPQRLSSGHTFVESPAIVVAGGGRTLATWLFQDGVGNTAKVGHSAASRAPGGTAFGIRRSLPGWQPIVGAYREGSVLLATPNRAGTRVFTRLGHADGSFGKRHTVRRGRKILSVSLAVNMRGDAALAWFEDRGTRTDRVYVSLRRAGHSFGAPRRLATGRVRRVATAIGASGDVLVAWDARGVLKTRFKDRGRSSFRKTDTIRSQDAFFADLHPVVTVGGRAVLAWSAQFASEGGDRGPKFFQAAVRVAHGKRFRRAQLLEHVDDPTAGDTRPVDATDDGAGNVIIAWTGAGNVVRAARVQQSGAVGAAQDVGTGFLSDLAASGFAVAVWDDGVDTTHSVVHAAVAPPGQPFGAAEDVTSPAGDARFGGAAVDPRTHEPTIVYSERPTGDVPTFASASTRSG
jgi:hypothetical protein